MKSIKMIILFFATIFTAALFAQAETEVSFVISDELGHSQTVIVGTDSSATDSIDANLSESELPPPPPSGIFDARLILPIGIASLVDIRPGLPDFGEGTEYQLSWQLSEGATELNMEWTLPEGVELTIQDLNGGSVINENFDSGEGSFTITNESIRSINLILKASGLVDVKDENLPHTYSLKQNYPNPFNPSTAIEFTLPVKSEVTLTVYNMIGEKIRTIANRSFSAGTHKINFNAKNLPSGIYIYSISTQGNKGRQFNMSRKMILLR